MRAAHDSAERQTIAAYVTARYGIAVTPCREAKLTFWSWTEAPGPTAFESTTLKHFQ